MDARLLAAAYDRSAPGYDERFRALQQVKFRAAAPFLGQPAQGALCLDAGGGTALFAEWAAAEAQQLLQGRWLVVDASRGMLGQALARTRVVAAADLRRLPLRPASCALVCSFTALLGDVAQGLRELGLVTAPGGRLVVSFLAAEAPQGEEVQRLSGLRLLARPRAAGQDTLFALGG